MLPSPETIPELNYSPPKLNWLAGPVFVEGAERGDLIAVNIEEVEPDDKGVSIFMEGVDPLSDSITWKELTKPYTIIIDHIPGPDGKRKNGQGYVRQFDVNWNLKPFIGTIGLCPDLEHESSLWGQGPWGGNYDCRHVCEGSIIYLNCYHQGGLLFAGDVHGTQADTEFYGFADETAAELQFSCHVVKNKTIIYPRIETKDSLIQLFCLRPLEEAVKQAIVGLMNWLVEDYGMDPKEAYMHMCVNPDMRVNIYQMVSVGRINYTVGAELPKKYTKK